MEQKNFSAIKRGGGICSSRLEIDLSKALEKIRSNKIECCLVVLFCLLSLVSFTFVYDLNHTASCSFAYLEGHWKDFYDYNISVKGMDTIVYYPTIYILFAIWNIPLYLFSGGMITRIPNDAAWLLVYEKIFCLTFELLCILSVYQFAKQIYKDNTKALHACFFLFTMPVFFLYEFPWALYDSVYLFFLMQGILHLNQHSRTRTILGILFLALALTCKTYSVFVIIPILFWRFKKVPALIGAVLGVVSVYALETVLYLPSDYFTNNVLAPLNGGFMFVTFFTTMLGNISVVLLVFVLVCLYSYCKCGDDALNIIWACFVISSLICPLSGCTPNWSLMMCPFLAILMAQLDLQERRTVTLINLAYAVAMLIYIMCSRSFAYGESALAAGVFGKSIYNTDMPYTIVLGRSAEFLTRRIYGSVLDGIQPGVDLYKYVVTAMTGVALYYAYALLPGKNRYNPVSPMEKMERIGIYSTDVCIMLLYAIPLIIWTVTL